MRLRTTIALAVLAAAPAAAQDNAPIGILRGDLVSWSGTARNGTLTFHNADRGLLRCTFDDLTWFEHENERIAMTALHRGDHLELVADRVPPSSACYARTVQVLDTSLPRRTAAGKPRLRSHLGATELWAPRGDMTFSGLVAAVDGNWLTLRLRDGARKSFLLRSDTRYLGEGLAQDRSRLTPQTMVFIRAGRNLDGDIEAYTIIWGGILQVRD